LFGHALPFCKFARLSTAATSWEVILIGNVLRHKVTATISMIDKLAKTVGPTKLVSGRSDDGSVKLWDMNQAIVLLQQLIEALGHV
jgi:hypothetical protein